MREFGEWLMQEPEKKPTKVELNSRREIVTAMMEDVNRMLTDCDNMHPNSVKEYSTYEQLPLYNNNVSEATYALYRGITKYEI